MTKHLQTLKPSGGIRLIASLLLAVVAAFPALATVKINPSELTIKVGEKQTLKIEFSDKDFATDYDTEISWSVDAEGKEVVKLEKEQIEGLMPGKVTVTATLYKASDNNQTTTATCEVTVKAADVPSTAMPAITLDQKEVTVEAGKSITLKAEAKNIPAEGFYSVMWRSSNEEVATVKEGIVNGITASEEPVTITATIENGTGQIIAGAKCLVTVKAAEAIRSISLTEEEITIEANQTAKLAAVVSPAEKVYWKSSNTDIVRVDWEGNVFAVHEGTALITASIGTATSGNQLEATCKVIVKAAEQPVEKVIFLPETYTLKVGGEVSLEAVLKGFEEGATVDWYVGNNSSSDPKVEIVANGNECIVKGLAEGEVVVIASQGIATDMISAQCKVFVEKADAPEVKKEIILPETVTLTVGEKAMIEHEYKGGIAATQVRWEVVEGKDVVEVDQAGRIIGLAVGQATVWAYTGIGTNPEAEAYCTVVVNEKAAEPVFGFAEDTPDKVVEGDSFTIEAINLPKDYVDYAYIEWISSDEEVATVDATGKVTFIKGGKSVTITARLWKGTRIELLGEASKEFEVIAVYNAPSMTISAESANLHVGETLELTANCINAPEGAEGEVKWISDNESVATVGLDTGVVTAVAEGTATIKAMWIKGTAVTYATETCEITVVAAEAETPAPSIIFDQEGETIELIEGDTYQLIAVSSGVTSEGGVRFMTKDFNDNVVTIDANGLVTAVGEGEATIVVYCGPATTPVVAKECTVKVSSAVVAEPSIILNYAAKTLTVGEKVNLKATVENAPEGAYVMYVSHDRSVATVDATGVVTAVAPGTTRITAFIGKGTDPDASFDCEITVEAKAEEYAISFDFPNRKMSEGETLTLVPEIGANAPEGHYVMWYSSDTDIATVDVVSVDGKRTNDAEVSAVAAGNVVITANLMEGTFVIASAECNIEVIETVSSEDPIAPSITLNVSEVTLDEGTGVKIEATKENAEDKEIRYFSYDKAVATVDNEGNVTAVAPGKTKILVYCGPATTPDFFAICEVTVNGVVKSVTVDPSEAEIRLNETLTLNAILEGHETADKSVVWSSSNEKIATVDNNGLVKALARGTTTISATAANGLTHFCTLTVKGTFVPTGIEGVEGDNAASVTVENGSIIAPAGSVVYNINGVAVNPVNLSTGVYFVRLTNGQTVKVII